MTAFWIVAALLTAGVVILLARPLMRRGDPLDAGGSDLAVYRDQLAELEREKARGLVEPAEAVSLEAEIGRRMLGASRSDAEAPVTMPPARRLTMLLTVLMPLGALVIYLAVGRPGPAGATLGLAADLAQLRPGQDFGPSRIGQGRAQAHPGRSRQMDHDRRGLHQARTSARPAARPSAPPAPSLPKTPLCRQPWVKP